MRTYGRETWWMVLLVIATVALALSVRTYQCRNAPDKLACMLSERVVYVVPAQ